MGLLAWIIFGIIVGILAELLVASHTPRGIIVTCLLGIVGAMVGGYLGSVFGYGGITGFNVHSFLWATGGAILILVFGRMLFPRVRIKD